MLGVSLGALRKPQPFQASAQVVHSRTLHMHMSNDAERVPTAHSNHMPVPSLGMTWGGAGMHGLHGSRHSPLYKSNKSNKSFFILVKCLSWTTATYLCWCSQLLLVTSSLAACDAQSQQVGCKPHAGSLRL